MRRASRPAADSATSPSSGSASTRPGDCSGSITSFRTCAAPRATCGATPWRRSSPSCRSPPASAPRRSRSQSATSSSASRRRYTSIPSSSRRSRSARRQTQSCQSAMRFLFPSTSAGGRHRTVDGGVHVARRARDSHRRPYSQRPHSSRHAGALRRSSASRHPTAPPSPPRATTVSGPPPVILSHRVWQELFDQNADAIGRVLSIDDEAHTVIGVMPERFWFCGHGLADLDRARSPDPGTRRASRRRRAASGRCDARRARRPAPERPRRLRAAASRPASDSWPCGRPDSKARQSATRCRSCCPTCSARQSC